MALNNYDPNLYGAVVAFYTTRLHAAAAWIMSPPALKVGTPYDAAFTHRRYILAAGLGEIAQLSHDGRLAVDAMNYAKQGIIMQIPNGWSAAITQNPDGTYPPAKLVAPGANLPSNTVSTLVGSGIDPEKTGYDCSYQCVGLMCAAYYYQVCPDANLRRALLATIVRGLTWEEQLIDASGNVSTVGSTRIGVEKTLEGVTKAVSFTEVKTAYQLGYQLTGIAAFQHYAAIVN